MSTPEVISLKQATEVLERLAEAVRETGDDSNGCAGVIVKSQRGAVVHGLQLAIQQLHALERYEVRTVASTVIVRDAEMEQLSKATMIQQVIERRVRTLLEGIGVYAHQEGLVDVTTGRAPKGALAPGERISVRCTFLRKNTEVRPYSPAHTAAQFEASWANAGEGGDDA